MKSRLFLRVIAVWLVTGIIAVAAPPNILIITCDNLGYGDLRSYNPDSFIKTPRLDRLASEGARMTSYYTASSTCILPVLHPAPESTTHRTAHIAPHKHRTRTSHCPRTAQSRSPNGLRQYMVCMEHLFPRARFFLVGEWLLHANVCVRLSSLLGTWRAVAECQGS